MYSSMFNNRRYFKNTLVFRYLTELYKNNIVLVIPTNYVIFCGKYINTKYFLKKVLKKVTSNFKQ